MTADLKSLVRLNKSQVKAASKTLTRAFIDAPFWAYLIPDASQRENIVPYLFEFRGRFCISYGEVYATSSNLEGIAMWLHSGNADMSLWRMIRHGWFSLYFKSGREVFSRRRTYGNYASSVHKRCAPFPHWYLSVIGVDPEFQGKGHASILLKPMLARIDQEHLPCYLETQTERNVPIYQHFGFKVVDESIVPGSGMTNWAMVREKSE